MIPTSSNETLLIITATTAVTITNGTTTLPLPCYYPAPTTAITTTAITAATATATTTAITTTAATATTAISAVAAQAAIATLIGKIGSRRVLYYGTYPIQRSLVDRGVRVRKPVFHLNVRHCSAIGKMQYFV